MFRQNDNGFRDGNEVYAYLPDGFLLGKEVHPGLRDWRSRWDRAAADSFAPKEIPHGPYSNAALPA